MTAQTFVTTGATFARQDHASTEYYTTAKSKISLCSATTSKFAPGYIYVASPVPQGAAVHSAFIEVETVGVWPGSRSLTMQATGPRPKTYRQTNYINKPAVADWSSPRAGVKVTSTKWRFDVTADYDRFSLGETNTGFQLVTSDTTMRQIYGFQAVKAPRLVIDWSLQPDAPTDLTPSDGAVSVAKPTLGMRVDEFCQAITVEFGTDEDFTGVLWSSGVVTTDVGQLVLAATSFPGLALGDSAWWRAKQMTPFGWSVVSDVHTFTRVANPAPVLSSPGTATADTTPPSVWARPGQTAWRHVTTVDVHGTPKVVDDSGWRSGTDTTYTPKKGAAVGGSATATIYVRDGVARVSTPGDPVESSASITYTLSPDPSLAVAATLTVDLDSVLPCAHLSITSGTVPDEWALFRETIAGEELIARFDGPDSLIDGSATVFEYQDWTVLPNREQTYRVAQVINGKLAAGGPTATLTAADAAIEGIWVIDPDTGRWFLLSGTADIQLKLGEASQVWTPLSAAAAIVRRSGLRGLEGPVGGSLSDDAGRTWEEMENDLVGMRETEGLVARLVTSDVNVPVVLRALTFTADPENSFSDRPTKLVSFEVYEQPETTGQ